MSSISSESSPLRSQASAPSRLLVLFVILGACLASFQWANLLDVVSMLDVEDTDDAMRLVAVRDLLHGQSWSDAVQWRFLPPAGVPMHWSRLIDAPLAAAILLLTPLVGESLAIGIVAAAWPAVLLFGFWVLVYAGVRALFTERSGYLAALLVVLSPLLAVSFVFGRVDHHNVQALTFAAVLLCLCLCPDRPALASVAGGVCGLSLAFGLETLPYVVLAGVVMGGDWILGGRAASGRLRQFCLALAVSAAGLFAVQTAPHLWTEARCDVLSPPWLLAGGLISLLLPAATALAPPRAWQRAALAALPALLGAAMVWAFYPQCLDGPWAEVPGDVRREWLGSITEMQSALDLAEWNLPAALGIYVPLLLAGLGSTALAFLRNGDERRVFAVLALFAWCGLAISLVQLRGAYVASAVVPIVAAYLLDLGLTGLERAPSRAHALLPIVLAVAMMGKLWALVALVEGSSERSRDATKPCRKAAALAKLASLPPGTILAPMDMGPFILLHTDHAIVSGSYHRAPAGLEAEYRGFASEASLRVTADRHLADYLVLCSDGADKTASPAKDYRDRLAAGQEPQPAWLERILPGSQPLVVWRVRRLSGESVAKARLAP